MHLNQIKNMIESGIDPNDRYSAYGKTLLHTSIYYNKIDCVKYLIEHGANVDIVDNDDHTPLCDAARYGHYDIVRYLLFNGASIDKSDNHGYTPLHLASLNNHVMTVKCLLDCGANKELKTLYGRMTAAMIAQECGHVYIANYIKGYEAVPTKGVHDN